MRKGLFLIALASVFVTVLRPSPAEAEFIKTPQYDQDKDGIHSPDFTCWMASASNMLAAAGYEGGNVQAIYDRMTAHYGWGTGGLQHQALSWYISTFPEPSNPYKLVSSYWGNTYANPDFILQELERCQYVGIGFWWGGSLGHAITVWGDNEATPRQGYFSDSDRDDGGDYTWYTWADHGGGDWFLDNYFATPIADVDYVATLCIPEPATICLLALGGLALFRRRRGR